MIESMRAKTRALDNVFWNTLSGAHARYSIGSATARRYAPGFSPIVGFADTDAPRFDALSPYCEPGEHFYCKDWQGTAPPDWRIVVEGTIRCMVWDGRKPEGARDVDATLLAPHDVAQALALVELTRPGPFGPRTIELGEYLGCFEDGRLVAMAGERMHAGACREISGVCTHPQQRGKGLARALMAELIHRQLARGELPFLHVMAENIDAHRLYRQMGFVDHRESVIRIVCYEGVSAARSGGSL